MSCIDATGAWVLQHIWPGEYSSSPVLLGVALLQHLGVYLQQVLEYRLLQLRYWQQKCM
jgi:hypothetical protein